MSSPSVLQSKWTVFSYEKSNLPQEKGNALGNRWTRHGGNAFILFVCLALDGSKRCLELCFQKRSQPWNELELTSPVRKVNAQTSQPGKLIFSPLRPHPRLSHTEAVVCLERWSAGWKEAKLIFLAVTRFLTITLYSNHKNFFPLVSVRLLCVGFCLP